MFKMGCSMARKILGPGPGSSSNEQMGPGAAADGGEKNGKAGANKSADEFGDFSKLEDDPRLPLNVRQIFKITKSWKAIARTMSKTGTAMFLNLFEQNQDLFYLFDRFQHLKGKELHDSMELREHAATVMATLDQSISSLSDYDNFVSYLHSIGQLHRKVPGFKRDYFWKIEQPFMKAVKQTLDERCNETIEQIYMIAIKLIIETIADGYGHDADDSPAAKLDSKGGPAGGAGSGAGSGSGASDGADCGDARTCQSQAKPAAQQDRKRENSRSKQNSTNSTATSASERAAPIGSCKFSESAPQDDCKRKQQIGEKPAKVGREGLAEAGSGREEPATKSLSEHETSLVEAACKLMWSTASLLREADAAVAGAAGPTGVQWHRLMSELSGSVAPNVDGAVSSLEQTIERSNQATATETGKKQEVEAALEDVRRAGDEDDEKQLLAGSFDVTARLKPDGGKCEWARAHLHVPTPTPQPAAKKPLEPTGCPRTPATTQNKSTSATASPPDGQQQIVISSCPMHSCTAPHNNNNNNNDNSSSNLRLDLAAQMDNEPARRQVSKVQRLAGRPCGAQDNSAASSHELGLEAAAAAATGQSTMMSSCNNNEELARPQVTECAGSEHLQRGQVPREAPLDLIKSAASAARRHQLRSLNVVRKLTRLFVSRRRGLGEGACGAQLNWATSRAGATNSSLAELISNQNQAAPPAGLRQSQNNNKQPRQIGQQRWRRQRQRQPCQKQQCAEARLAAGQEAESAKLLECKQEADGGGLNLGGRPIGRAALDDQPPRSYRAAAGGKPRAILHKSEQAVLKLLAKSQQRHELTQLVELIKVLLLINRLLLTLASRPAPPAAIINSRERYANGAQSPLLAPA